MAQSRWLVVAGSAAALLGGALIGLRSHKPATPVPLAQSSASSSASGAASVAAPPAASPSEPRTVLDFTFDCAGLPAAPEACPGASPLAAKLVESSLWTSTGMPLCANALKGARADAAAQALRAAQALKREQLPPLERALVQNAALRLLACSANVEKDAQRKEIAQNAKRLVKTLALDATQIAALPSSASALGWLGDGSGWQVGALRTHVHESADGYVSTLERAQHEQEFASIYRLILVDDQGQLHATDVVSKLFLRRPAAEAGRFSACIAALDPTSAHCSVAALRPVSAALQSQALTLGGTPACHMCHAQNHANSLSFGPSRGLGPETVSLDRARESLAQLLAP